MIDFMMFLVITEKGLLEIYKDMICKLLQGEWFSVTRGKRCPYIRQDLGGLEELRIWGAAPQIERERRKLG